MTAATGASAVRLASTRSRSLPKLPPAPAFVGTAIIFVAFYAAAGAPTPLFVVYEARWAFPPALLTIAFSAYAIAMLVSLLVVGSLSDYVGRRPVLIAGLVLEIASMMLFLVSPNIGWIIVARLLQGLATGTATSAYGAAIIELVPGPNKKTGVLVTAVGSLGGLGVGALLSGLAVQLTSSASTIIFVTLTVIMSLGIVIAIFTPETASPRPGVLRSLVPRIAVPAAARREFMATVPVHLAAWMLAALFMGLMPTIIREAFHIDSGLINGAASFLQPGPATIAGLVLGGLAARRTTMLGSLCIGVGATVIVTAIATGIFPLLWVGGSIAGFGFGASYSGAIRLVIPFAELHERAGLLAAVSLVGYLSYGVPAIVAGQITGPAGIVPTIVGFGSVVVALAVVALIAELRLARSNRLQLS